MIFKSIILSFFVFSFQLNASELTVKMTLSPAGSFEAKTAKVHGEIKKNGTALSAESIWIKIEDLKTGIDLRDEHFHKHLNFEKFPKITLNQIVADNSKATGMLTVNNVTKKIDFSYKLENPTKVVASFKVKPSAFNLKEAKYLEIGVDDEVQIDASIDIK